jgi:alpha-glucosidase
MHGQPEYFFSNHDQPRHWDRYGDGAHNDQIAKLMATLLLTTRGTPQMYYGEELGMRTTDPVRIEDVHDPVGKLGWPMEKGRDGERTPMQWNASSGAGFTTSPKPWLPIPFCRQLQCRHGREESRLHLQHLPAAPRAATVGARTP